MSARIGVLAGAIGTCFAAQAVNASIIHATHVESFAQGLQANGAVVVPERCDVSQALGAPQNADTLNFVSIGFGGSIILSFGQSFTGPVTIVETTYNDPSRHPEDAEIFVGIGATWDTATFYSLGLLQNAHDNTPMPVDAVGIVTGTTEFNFLMIQDRSDRSLLPPDADGFDVDGVSVMAVPAPASGALAMLALAAGAGHRRRRA